MPPTTRPWRYAAVLLVLAGCRPINTLPDPVSPTDPVQEFALEIPANLEVRHVDFSATTFADDAAIRQGPRTAVGGRGFIEVYAVDRATGEAVLLIYEDVGMRKQPLQIIRFKNVPGGQAREP